MKGNDYVTLPEMARKRLGIRCTLTLSWISEWLISVFHMTGKVKIIWLTVCSPLRLWQALLNFLTTSSQLIWREASHPPQVTHTHGHTRTQSHTCTTTSLPCDWHCDTFVLKRELQYAASGRLTLHQSIFTRWEWQLFRVSTHVRCCHMDVLHPLQWNAVGEKMSHGYQTVWLHCCPPDIIVLLHFYVV